MRLNVNLSEELYLTLRAKLAKDNITVTEFITKVIKWYVRGFDEKVNPDTGARSGSSSSPQGSGSEIK